LLSNIRLLTFPETSFELVVKCFKLILSITWAILS